MTTDPSTTTGPAQPSSLELAVVVANRVEITNVFLLESRVLRPDDEGRSLEGRKLDLTVSSVRFGPDAVKKHLFVLPTFGLKAPHADDQGEKTGSPPRTELLIEATFVLTYAVNSFDGLEPSHLEAFSLTNGIYNAWPYWREFVREMTARMGLKPITVPVFRFADKTVFRFEGEPSSGEVRAEPSSADRMSGTEP